MTASRRRAGEPSTIAFVRMRGRSLASMVVASSSCAIAMIAACADAAGGVTVRPQRGDASTGDMGPGSLLRDGGGASDASAPSDASGPVSDANEGLMGFVVMNPALPAIAPFTECTIVQAESISMTGGHVASCAPLVHDTLPPTHGDHYPVLPEMREYDSPVPWGFLLEAMDRGAVVLLHNCPSGCDEVLERFRGIQMGLPAPDCDAASIPPRLIIAPDPTLDVSLAAVAWGHVMKATCLDAPRLMTFVGAHYGDRGPASSCEAGVDPRTFCGTSP